MSFPNEFSPSLVWTAIQVLLTAQLGGQVNVDCIGEKDFDEDGDLTITAPAARVLYIDTRTSKPEETQHQVYNVDHAFSILCAAEDISAVQSQRIASIALAEQVQHLLVGARIQLGNGEESEPAIYAGTSPLPTADLGMAYAVQLVVSGITQFAAPNATAAQQAAQEAL